MTLNELMEILALNNIRLSTKSGELSVSANKGTLTPELQAQLKLHKSAIIGMLERSIESESQPSSFEIVPNIADLDQPFPLSDLQVAFYMADDPYMEYHVRPHYYSEKDVECFDVNRYKFALNRTLRRHKNEIVLLNAEKQLQLQKNFAEVDLKINDFRTSEPEVLQAELLSIRERMMRQELPLDRWPWFDIEVSLWREQGVDKARIHANQNNFYGDGLGTSVLQEEIDGFYVDPELELPPIKISLRDAILGLQQLSESAMGERAKRYWLDRLPDLPEPPPLPQIPGVNRKCRSKLQRREYILPAELWRRLKENATSYGVTPSSTIITAYAEILSCWSGSRHFILSNMVTRRLPLHEDMFKILGNFASLYPFEVDLRGDITFGDKVLRIQQQILRDSDYRQWGGMQVMQAFNRLKGEFGTVPCPFVVGSGLFMGGYQKADFSCLETSQTIFDHQFWELEDGSYYCVWDLLEEFFPPGMINDMWQSYKKLLTNLAENRAYWQNKVFRLAVPPDFGTVSERESMPVPKGLLHRGLAASVKYRSSKAVLQTMYEQFTYQQLDALSNAVALQLQTLTVKPNELVAIALDRGAALISAIVGTLKTGAAYVPIDTNLPNERIQFLLEDTQTRVVLTQASYQDRIRCPPGVTTVLVDELAPLATIDLPALTQPDDVAYVIYTSGSTGQPKGVVIDHRAALNTIVDINRRFGIQAHDKIFGVSSSSFDLSVYDVFGVLDIGATLIYPYPEAAYNPAHWLDLMSAREVTVWNSAPPLMSLLVETALRQKRLLPTLRLVMLSGDWIPIDLPGQIKRIAPNASIVSLGGATEAAIWSIYFPIDRVDSQWVSIPYGKPLTNQGWQIRDAIGRRTPTWTVGELFITGVGLAKGYWRDEGKTQRSFIRDSKTGERLYRTGDLGRFLPDGNIEFMGRADAQVKIQGHRIELGEVEAALRENPLVKEVIVLAASVSKTSLENAQRPDVNKQLVAYLVPYDKDLLSEHTARDVAVQALKTFLQEKLPIYMVPSGWSFIQAIPITPNGKIDRKELTKNAFVSGGESEQRPSPIAPRTAAEAQIAQIWCGVLNLNTVGVNQDFFDLGGKSFDAVRCVSLIKEKMGFTFSLGDFWKERTIDKFANRILQGNITDGTQRLFCTFSAGEGEPYFFVHPGGGQYVGYFPLAERLSRPSYAFLGLAEDVDQGLMASIEAIAARYISLMRQQQPNGPYTIAGWSSGGCIAFEMAAQLELSGQSVARVFMLDAPSPMQHSPISTTDMLKGFFEDLALDLPTDRIHQVSLGGDPYNDFENIISLFNRDVQQRNANTLVAEQLYPIYRVFNACVNAVRNYRPSRNIKAEIVVLRAGEGIVSEFADHPCALKEDWGWSRLSTQPAYVETLPGTHHTLLQSPNVDAVARVMNGIRIKGDLNTQRVSSVSQITEGQA